MNNEYLKLITENLKSKKLISWNYDFVSIL